MAEPGVLTGVLVEVRRGGVPLPGRRHLPAGVLDLVLVVEGLPVGELPAGARLGLGEQVLIEIDAPAADERTGQGRGGLRERGEGETIPARVVEPGSIAPGDAVQVAAVAVRVSEMLDLHSFRPADVPAVVREYLDEARRAGFREVRLVHGRGRGVQRAAVRRVLAELPGVAAFAEAPPARGGWGATLVRLRPPEPGPSA